MANSAHQMSLADFEDAATRPRDTRRPVVLIGFQEQGNLGLGYLASTLRAYGYRVEVLDFELEPAVVLETVEAASPILIGFSLIFQFCVHRFGALASYLREHDVTCHFTMGGHFPSLSYNHTLDLVPQLDSVVRFEGELTLLELVDLLSTERDWRTIQGIAYRQGGEKLATSLRPLIADLDLLPYPERSSEPAAILGRRVMPILASRGCARTCSFCSIHMFYRAAPGKVVRTRRPAQVVQEMRTLHEQQGVSVFLFQDDDFPLYGPVWRRWARDFVDELYRNELPGRVLWKINCRADVVEPELFATMRDAGLFLVYMGLESGSEEGLEVLHKQITVEQNLRAVEILKALNLRFEFGFMLLDPSTTFESVRDNVQFLRAIVGDGSTAAGFGRMVPYDGTPIKDSLARAGRLRGDVCNPDYDFLDPRLHAFSSALVELVHVAGWQHGIEALSPQLSYAWSELAIMERLFPRLPGLQAYQETLRDITRATNELLFRVVEDMSEAFSDGGRNVWSGEALRPECERFLGDFLEARNAFVLTNQPTILDALRSQRPPAGTGA
jgi:anaerobic magnesium-protoporphyrin IX monomethyl ester cyclase